MMCELPSNAVIAEQFLEHFDGFSIGSNDMTQLTLGLDRDSSLVAAGFDERDPAVKFMLSAAIAACKKQGKYVGICGQGPSDHPDLAQWLLEQGIDSLSLNPDTVVDTWMALSKKLARPLETAPGSCRDMLFKALRGSLGSGMPAQLIDLRIDRRRRFPSTTRSRSSCSGAITDGRLEPGDPFENEMAMCDRLGLSRPTVRRAIQEMVDRPARPPRRGRDHGGEPQGASTVRASSLFDELKRAGRLPEPSFSTWRWCEDAARGEALDLDEGAETLVHRPAAAGRGKPLALLHDWLPPEYFDLDPEELEVTGLYEASANPGRQADRRAAEIGARMPTPTERRHLGLRGASRSSR